MTGGVQPLSGDVMIGTPALCGLVLAGGKSSRMGTDKAQLRVHGRREPQYRFLLGELDAVCGCAYLSERLVGSREHAPEPPTVQDRYPEIGPLAGVLSAFEVAPERAWLVLAVDLINITRRDIQQLTAGRVPSTPATAGYNPELGGPEPLFAIYEPAAFPVLRERYERKQYSLRKALLELGAAQVRSFSQQTLTNVNTPDELRAQK